MLKTLEASEAIIGLTIQTYKLPTRVSVDQRDIGFIADTRGIEIWFNDVKISNCITADSEEGTILAYVIEDDKVAVDYVLNEAKTQVYKGKVEIKYTPCFQEPT